MKNETAGVSINKLAELKSKMNWFLVNDSNEHKKAKGVNRNNAEKIYTHN